MAWHSAGSYCTADGRGVVTFVRWGKPFLLGTPVCVDLGGPDIFATKAEAGRLEPHGFVTNGAGKNDEICPRKSIAVLLLYWPEQAAGLVQAGQEFRGAKR